MEFVNVQKFYADKTDCYYYQYMENGKLTSKPYFDRFTHHIFPTFFAYSVETSDLKLGIYIYFGNDVVRENNFIWR